MNPVKTQSKLNTLLHEDRPVHGWYRFVLSYPPHVVREYLQRFEIGTGDVVFDPFCGTGTTLVECKKSGISSIGFEANHMTHFASQVKVNWQPKPQLLWQHALCIAEAAQKGFSSSEQITDLLQLAPETHKLLLTDSISPLPLHKALVLLHEIEKQRHEAFYEHERLAFASAAVGSFSNLHFGPEVGIGRIKHDTLIIEPWLQHIKEMVDDLEALQDCPPVAATAYFADARHDLSLLAPCSIDAVITSPPYPNEKDYTRITRLETVLLGFIHNKADLQSLKKGLLRSNTRTVYKGDQDDIWIQDYDQIEALAQQIEARRIELGKTSGFERLYSKVTRLYFGGMAKHLADLRRVLRPGAQLAYVVGDQASFFRIMIRTGQLLGDIAQELGYELVSIDLFRTRLSTVTGEQLREEVVVLRWKGNT